VAKGHREERMGLASVWLMASTETIEAFLAEPRNVMVAGVRKSGRPHLSPNWFHWDGQQFVISITRSRVKYAVFTRDPRVELAVDDSTAFRTVLIHGTAEIHEDLEAELPRFRAIREKHGREVPSDEQFLEELRGEGRVLLVITPDGPPSSWTSWGLD
jgi:PPOX class probable F420-dependent enzyme